MEAGAGERLLAQLQDPATTEAWRQTVDSTAPGFDQWIVDSVFGGTYQRAGLSLQERQIATLAALAALGGVEPQLDGHIETAARLGLDARQIAEIFVHLAPYIGLPRTIAALRRVAVASP
jgi:4-carboxymuconolactone decarboxylase